MRNIEQFHGAPYGILAAFRKTRKIKGLQSPHQDV